jgi:hypothetical protein
MLLLRTRVGNVEFRCFNVQLSDALGPAAFLKKAIARTLQPRFT